MNHMRCKYLILLGLTITMLFSAATALAETGTVKVTSLILRKEASTNSDVLRTLKKGEELEILQVRPGITDYSSVEFINLDEIVGTENADEMYEKHVLKKKNALRVKYARTVSFRTDVYILFKTVAAVLKKAFGFIVKKEHR